MYATEIRELSDAELVTKLLDLKEELFNLRFQNATGSLEKHNLISKVKKEIARVETVISEREIASTDSDQGDK